MVDKPIVARLKKEGPEVLIRKMRERNQRIDVGNDAVSLRLEHPREDGREQVAQKTHRNGADTVNGGLFGQLFKHLFSIAPAHKAFYPAKIRISESNVKFI